ncbi:MAG: methyl-accepting chemotaxis protein [Halothiobacillus sp.]|nr:methyl-accepting chemotaxis protein [Halothiobacillus sp.]
MKKPSILRRLKWSFIGMGILMGLIFPVFASYFVTYRPGMLKWFILGCILAGITVGIVNYWITHVVMLRQLMKIARLAIAVRQGDLTGKCDVVSADSVGEISDSFNGMISTLHRQIGDINRGSTSMNQASETLHGLIGQVLSGQDRVETQRGRVITEVDHLASSGVALEGAMQRVGEQVRAMKARSEQGQGQIARSVESIHEAITRVEESTIHIRGLVSAKDEVERMTRTIGSVADQTNLLALTAAIEAARAGAHGRGFAVVAEEVRALAKRSRDATVEIAAVMERLTRDVTNTDRTMSEVVSYSQQAESALSSAQLELVEILVSIEKSLAATCDVEADNQRHQRSIELLHTDLTTLVEVIASGSKNMHQAKRAVDSVQKDSHSLATMVEGFRI